MSLFLYAQVHEAFGMKKRQHHCRLMVFRSILLRNHDTGRKAMKFLTFQGGITVQNPDERHD